MTRPRAIILAVDDSPATLGMLNETLEQAGYAVLVAQSGTSALTLIEHVTPDIVLMDALMLGLDGFEILSSNEAKYNAKICADRFHDRADGNRARHSGT